MIAGLLTVWGCGSTNNRAATEQLILSDAVDRAIAQIDFSPLSGRKVFLDVSYLQNYKGIGFVNSEYVISSLRQQIVGAGCLLQETRETADFVIEGRVGALGNDSHDIVYGLPASNALSTAATAISGAPPIPTIPEISLARRQDQLGAAKIAVFAYHRESRQRVWQSGVAVARSKARDSYLFGIGPFQSGTAYDGLRFAGEELPLTFDAGPEPAPLVSEFDRTVVFTPPAALDPPRTPDDGTSQQDGVVQTSAETEAKPP